MVTQAQVQFDGDAVVMGGWRFEQDVETSRSDEYGDNVTTSWTAWHPELLRSEPQEVQYSFFGFATLQAAVHAVQLFETARGIVHE